MLKRNPYFLSNLFFFKYWAPVFAGKELSVNCPPLTSTASRDPSLRLMATSPGTVGFQAQSLTVVPSVDESLTS